MAREVIIIADKHSITSKIGCLFLLLKIVKFTKIYLHFRDFLLDKYI